MTKKFSNYKRFAYSPICGSAREIMEYMHKTQPSATIDKCLIATAKKQGFVEKEK